MRILNRPMFKYGGPIKEGVMHGMRNNYQSGQLVRPGPGRPGYQGTPYSTNYNLIDWKNANRPYRPLNITNISDVGSSTSNATKIQRAKNLLKSSKFSERGAYEALKKYGPKALNWVKGGIGGAFTRFPGMTQLAAYYAAAKPTPVDVKYDITRKENLLPMFGDTKATVEKKIKRNLAEESNPNNPWRYNKYKHGPRKEHPDYDPEKSSYWPWAKGAVEEGGADGTKKIIPSDKPEHLGLEPYTDPDKAKKLAKQKQNERLKSYLDMMGYDRSKKTALSDALIDASAIVQQGTDEAGSLKEADWGKLINQAIQTTSKRLDKPEQIREAVGLMMTKSAIEKDLSAEENKLAKELTAKRITKLDKELNPSSADLALAASSKTGKVTQPMLENIVRSNEGVENFKASFKDEKDTAYANWLDDNKNASEMKFMKDVVSKESDFSAGFYVFPDRIVEVKDDLTMKWYY